MSPAVYSRLLQFLQEELSLPINSISIAERHLQNNPGPLPMVLWQYGLVTIEQLDRIYEWLETA